MSPSPPPVAHTGKKSPTAAAATGTAAMGTALPEAADLMEGTAPSDYAASTECDTLQGKTFAQQMHAILAMPNYSSIISWNEAGTVAIIHDVDAFISTIMPAHFEHSQWGSFTRRMRRWGFRVANQRSSTPSAASERGQSNVMEFSSENFLRDQPDLCLLMKDERQVKKKFTFLDLNVRRFGVGVEHGTQGSSAGVSVPHPPSSSRGGTVMPSSENKLGGSMTPPSAKNLPLPVHYPPSPSSTLNTAKNQPDSQSEVRESSTVLKSTGDDDLNVDMDVGFPQNYSQETSAPPMISPNVHSFPMPMMNTMPAQPPPFHYPPYGYGAPPPQGPGFWPVSPAFQYSYVPYGYPPSYQQPQPQPQQQQQRQRLSTIDTRASASAASASTAQLLSSSSEESPRNEFDLLPNKKHSNVPIQPRLDAERKQEGG